MSTDIYKMKESPEAASKPRSTSHRRRRSRETFDEAMNKDVSKTNRRRSRNGGLRRLQHMMKKPDFSKKFWTIVLSVSGLILISLLLWDQFFRYAKPGG